MRTLPLLASLLALTAAGCAKNADGSINVKATAQNAYKIGADVVTFDCANATALAASAAAASRVKSALDANAALTAQFCPYLDVAAKVAVKVGL